MNTLQKRKKVKWERSRPLSTPSFVLESTKLLFFLVQGNNCALRSSFYHPSSAGVCSALIAVMFLKRYFFIPSL